MCEKCVKTFMEDDEWWNEHDEWWKHEQERLAMNPERPERPDDHGFDMIPDHPEAQRPDDSDLTRLIWKLPVGRSTKEWNLAWAMAWKIWFCGFALAVLAIVGYWLGKQAGLWG